MLLPERLPHTTNDPEPTETPTEDDEIIDLAEELEAIADRAPREKWRTDQARGGSPG